MAAPPERRQRSDLGARVLAAIPAIVFAIFIIAEGGWVFAVGILALGVLALGELSVMFSRVRPPMLAGMLAVGAMVVTAQQYGNTKQVALALVASFPVTFFLALMRPRRANVSWALAVTYFAVLWVGLPLVYAVLLRKLPHGNGLIVDVLVGTFIGDTAAYFGGRGWGRTPLAPTISPNKTLEGAVTGFIGGTLAFWFAGLYQDWLTGRDAIVIGAFVALAAPIGDLFESLVKRDLGVKDTGRFFGAHGGVLDRLDAVLFTIVAGYFAAVGLGYT
ncbi:MAG: phosphatidate cytidylyltransferase [Thermoleophilaceae bacterium]